MESLKIILMSVSAAIGYGILHDQVTARVCVEYFTVGHPPIFVTDDPTLLAFGWGALATWWFGLFLGIPLALLARRGPPPQVPARVLVKPIALLMVLTGVTALLAGCLGYLLADFWVLSLLEPVILQLPPAKRAPYLADSFAHGAGYVMGFVGGIGVWMWAWYQRD